MNSSSRNRVRSIGRLTFQAFSGLLLFGLAIAISLFGPFSGRPLHASAVQVATSDETQETTILVRFSDGATPDARAAWIDGIGGELVTWMPQINAAEIRIPGQSGATVAALRQPASGVIAGAEANLAVHATYAPNDPDFSDNTMSYGLRQVDALAAWDIVTGSQQIVIAVIDSGINADHPEFAGRLVEGYDFIEQDSMADDRSGHGTHVAGVVAAALDNEQGVAGVCPNCRLMPIKVLDKHDRGTWAQLAQGILFAADHGARVINISVGFETSSEIVASALSYAVESGAVIVAAAGNNNTDDEFYPAAYPDVIAVGAVTEKQDLWVKSDFGAYIDLVAPGDIVFSTYNDLDNLYRGYTFMSGTSMAAPFVSGVAGLLLSVAPMIGAEDVTDALFWGAVDLGDKGKDPEFGYGEVNARRSLQAPVEDLVKAVGEISAPKVEPVIFLPMIGSN